MNERAPDAIEPYVGYKWLHVGFDYTLTSNMLRAQWPHKRALEAVCAGDWGYHWTPVSSGEEQLPWKRGKREVVISTTVTSEVVAQWWIGDDCALDHKPPKKPKLILPAGYAWSYAPRPCPHEPVDPTCSCGIYVLQSQADAKRYAHFGKLLVKVALWGKVIPGDKGARGQYAYPLEICVSKTTERELLRKVGANYGIPFPGQNQDPSPRQNQEQREEPHHQSPRKSRLW